MKLSSYLVGGSIVLAGLIGCKEGNPQQNNSNKLETPTTFSPVSSPSAPTSSIASSIKMDLIDAISLCEDVGGYVKTHPTPCLEKGARDGLDACNSALDQKGTVPSVTHESSGEEIARAARIEKRIESLRTAKDSILKSCPTLK